jgi:hypothetical protein
LRMKGERGVRVRAHKRADAPLHPPLPSPPHPHIQTLTRLPHPPTIALAVPTTPTLYMLVVHWMHGMTAARDMAMKKRHAA